MRAENTAEDEVADGANVIVRAEDIDNTRMGTFEESTAYLSSGKRILRSSGVDAARFTFSTPIAKAGWYRVYMWWPVRPGGSAGIRTRVIHARGIANRTVDQSAPGGRWRMLGIFAFEAGGSAPRVELSATAGQSLLADAVRLQFAGAQEPRLKIRTNGLAIAEVGEPFEAILNAEGGDGAYTWSVVSGLPAGLTLQPDGRLSGRPEQAGESDVVVQVRDGSGKSARRRLRLDIVPAQKLESSGVTAPVRFAARRASAVAGSTQLAVAGVVSLGATGASLASAPDLTSLLTTLRDAPEGTWVRANLNRYADVWPPAELRPLYNSGNPTPEKIILAWSSFAWDSNRARLWLYGGGHANYSGNDVYTWDASTQLWQRAALSSEIVADSLGIWMAIDGVDNAPASAHTYDNNIFLPIVDRFLTFGGGTQDGAGNWRRQATPTTSRRTGPYLFDPNRADGNKVGGSTGSHVQRVAPHPEIVGGNMWQNRDLPLNFPTPSLVPASHSNGCTAYAEEGGKDVVYFGARPGSGTNLTLYRYVINDVADPRLDSLAIVGSYGVGPSATTTCAYDPVTKLLVRNGNSASVPFTYWNLNTAGPTNRDIVVPLQDPGGVFLPLVQAGTLRPHFCGMDFDPARRKFLLWCGDDRVWSLTSPTGGSGWVIQRETGIAGATGIPTLGPGTGVLGKWKYASNLDAFVGLQDIVAGNVWLYKPAGWVDPGGGSGNLRPSVSITSPQPAAQFTAGDSIVVQASASDPDGDVANVQFFNGSTLIGEASAPPYGVTWNNVPPGNYSLTAVAADDLGASTTSAAVSISVLAAGSGEVTLQDGTAGYAGTRDSYISRVNAASNFGRGTSLNSNASDSTPLVRFAIFQSEGGPVPDGAVITSATLSLYKSTAYDHVYRVHRILQAWDETQVSWNSRLTGQPWGAAGCNASGIDFDATPDGQASVSWNPQWLEIDVTAAVQAMSGGSPNHGWKLVPVSGNANLKRFHAREFATTPGLRPKLTIGYSAP